MKTLYLIGGTMGVGKTTVSQQLKQDTADVIDRSLARISLYQTLDTIKIDTSNKTVQMIANEIIQL
ncbi:MAG: hypothetical protein IKK03_14390 [Lachnospiraceae bacterium]|nr:hypothetical protein [Lachnospiraceae bacterium]